MKSIEGDQFWKLITSKNNLIVFNYLLNSFYLEVQYLQKSLINIYFEWGKTNNQQIHNNDHS